ncbi:MAG: hypothetical protein NTY69_03920 [Methylococcales bacterium]|nr:hypothetical protein [Methylococcales bacterium]
MSTNLFKIQSLTLIILLSAGECKAALYDRGNGLIFVANSGTYSLSTFSVGLGLLALGRKRRIYF